MSIHGAAKSHNDTSSLIRVEKRKNRLGFANRTLCEFCCQKFHILSELTGFNIVIILPLVDIEKPYFLFCYTQQE